MKTERTDLPKYMRTARLLIREISSGRLLDGEKLPPERYMASDLGIAVGTLRKALDDLVAKGLLERVQGSGNYIRHNPELAADYTFFRLEGLDGGGVPTARVLSVEKLDKPRDVPKFGRSQDGHRVRLVRLISGLPSAMEEIWLDGKWASEIKPNTLPNSLYSYYREALGVLITHIEDSVGVGSFPAWSVPDIGRAPGQTAGFVERFSQSGGGEVVEFSRTWFNPDRVHYVARFK